MSSFNEFEGVIGNQYFPFDDGQQEREDVLAAISAQTESGYITSTIDRWRQGVEITSAKHLYGSTQPKMWAGNLLHRTRVSTYGQARTWVEYTNSVAHDDRLEPFDVTRYIEDPENYPQPIYFNEGPQNEEEAIIEPLTIPFRKSPQEGALPPHRPKAGLEDGNSFDDPLTLGTNRIEQFQSYSDPLVARFFLDDGQEYIGAGTLDDMIVREGFVPFIQREQTPFNELDDEEIVERVDVGSGGDSEAFLDALKALRLELDEDIRQNYTQKSATAGTSVYGTQQARYGTDSITFLGRVRGS